MSVCSDSSGAAAEALEDLGVVPDLHETFRLYDMEFFDGALQAVEVRWSTRMTRCAGICRYESGGFCSIALSEPLLKFRPPKNMRETLLHEMIHAYLFVKKGLNQREAHGDDFKAIMRRINDQSGLNVTITHDFYEEVAHHQRHVWRCTGPCRFKAPRFGWLKRAMNRAPGPNDAWWPRHQLQCGGTFVKVSSPPEKTKNQLPAKTKKAPAIPAAPSVARKRQPTLLELGSLKRPRVDVINISDDEVPIRTPPRRSRIPEAILRKYESLPRVSSHGS